MVEFTLVNGGQVSSTDVTLIPPCVQSIVLQGTHCSYIYLSYSHTFSVATGFGYYNGCDGVGNNCQSASCPGAFHQTGDYGAQRQCVHDNVCFGLVLSQALNADTDPQVNLAITFCD